MKKVKGIVPVFIPLFHPIENRCFIKFTRPCCKLILIYALGRSMDS